MERTPLLGNGSRQRIGGSLGGKGVWMSWHRTVVGVNNMGEGALARETRGGILVARAGVRSGNRIDHSNRAGRWRKSRP